MLLPRVFHSSPLQEERHSSGSYKALNHLLVCLPLVQIPASAIISIEALRLKPSEIQCFDRSFSWSPASLEIEYHWETFDNIDLFIDTPYSGLTQTDEIEQAWDKILPGRQAHANEPQPTDKQRRDPKSNSVESTRRLEPQLSRRC